MSFQHVDELAVTTLTNPAVPMQLLADFGVADADNLQRHYKRALSFGATLLLDRTADPQEALYVMADPAGHPLYLLVG